MVSPRTDISLRFKDVGICWPGLSRGRAKFKPMRTARTPKDLLAMLRGKQPGLLRCLTLEWADRGAWVARVAKVRAVVDAATSQVVRSERLKARMPAVHKTCNVYTGLLPGPAQSLVALE